MIIIIVIGTMAGQLSADKKTELNYRSDNSNVMYLKPTNSVVFYLYYKYQLRCQMLLSAGSCGPNYAVIVAQCPDLK